MFLIPFLCSINSHAEQFVPDSEVKNGEAPAAVVIEADGPSETFKDEESKVFPAQILRRESLG